MAARINFNGQEYNSPDKMPPQVRQLYERAIARLSQNQQGALSSPKINIKVKTNLRFKYNGQIYNSLDELPPDMRDKYANIANQVDEDHDGVPDFLEGKGDAPLNSSNTNSGDAFAPSAPIAPLTPASPVISSDRPATRLLIVAGAIIVLLLFAVIIMASYIYLH